MLKTKLCLTRISEKGILIREQESRSWVRHFFDLWYPLLCNLTLANINDIGGNLRTLGNGDRTSPNLAINGPPGNTGMAFPKASSQTEWTRDTPVAMVGQYIGIVVGTNNAAASPSDNALGTMVAHGEAAGELLYGGCGLYGMTFVNPNGQFSIRRYLTNVLGGAISIQEVGIYAPAIRDGNQYCDPYCIARDVVAPAVTVNNGEILAVVYTVQITV